jgi:hypothetical protein
MNHVTICHNPVDPATWERAEVPDLLAYLSTKWKTLPEFARIYEKQVSKDNEVTPSGPDDERGIEKLAGLEGPFFVVLYADGAAAPYIVAVLLTAAAIALQPKIPAIPAVSQRNQTAPSPNNELSSRVNRPRLNSRIPDIYGQVRSTPDLIASSYSIFENNAEVEYSYACIGRGSYEVEDIRDGDTLCKNIPGTTIQVYAPFTSPNSGDEPQLRIGTPRNIPILRTSRSNSVNGQVLRPPNTMSFQGFRNIRFVYPNIVELASNVSQQFTQSFVNGDIIDISDAVVTSAGLVVERLGCRATLSDLRFNYRFQAVSGTYTYETAGGALLFELTDSQAVNSLFGPGGTITLTQTKGSSKYPGKDLSGTYEIEEVYVNEWASDEEEFFVKKYVIVKLVDPETVNSDWNDIDVNDDSWDYFSEAGIFEFDISHDTEAAGFDADLSGTYEVLNVTNNIITLNNPEAVNADWLVLETNGGVTPFISPLIESNSEGRWVGPFILTDSNLEQILCNFVAQNGLYKDDGTDQFSVEVEIEVEATPVDNDDLPLADPESFRITLAGSSILKETVAITMKEGFSSFFGRCSVRARRVTLHDDEFEGTVIDEVRWRDLYSAAVMDKFHFGDVTTVQSVVYATASALAVKERKLNMLVTRKLPQRIDDTSEFNDVDLVPTVSAADAIVAISRDRYIGNRKIAEIDVSNIYDTVTEVVDYFGHAYCGQFSYTFDNDAVSYEESMTILAQALNCIAYRMGNVIRLSFEKQTVNSVLLLNHRTKIPGSETRTFDFGINEDNDGVELTYVNPNDDSIATIYLPVGYAAVNPKKVETLGIRNFLQAYFMAWRVWNKIQFSNLNVEFEATQEASLLIRNDRILVTDSTSNLVPQDGEVVAIDGLELTLSQAVDLSVAPSYSIFLQHTDGSVESLDITAGSAPNKVLLADAPTMALAVDKEGYTRAAYVIVGSEDEERLPFIVSERTRQGKMTFQVRAYNYDERYYQNDLDFINNVIGEDGFGPSGGWVPSPEEPPYNPGEPQYLPTCTQVTSADLGDGLFGWSEGIAGGPSFGGSILTEKPTDEVIELVGMYSDGAINYLAVDVLSGDPPDVVVMMVDEVEKNFSIDAVYNVGINPNRYRYINTGALIFTGVSVKVICIDSTFNWPDLQPGDSFVVTTGRDNWIGGVLRAIGYPGDDGGGTEELGAINGVYPIYEEALAIPALFSIGLVASSTSLSNGDDGIEYFRLQVFMKSGNGNDFPGPNVTRVQVEGIGTFNIADAGGNDAAGPPIVDLSSWSGTWATGVSWSVNQDRTVTFLGPP